VESTWASPCFVQENQLGLKPDGLLMLVISCNEAVRACGNAGMLPLSMDALSIYGRWCSDRVTTDKVCECAGDAMCP
jgi:hypothetical protein